MQHIVFLVGSYYPDFAATGQCVYNVAKLFALQPQSYTVTVVCQATQLSQPVHEKYQLQRILRISTPAHEKRLSILLKTKSTNPLQRFFASSQLYLWRASHYLKMFLGHDSLRKSWVQAFEHGLSTIDEQIDLIIPVCSPFETIIAAIHFCTINKKTKVVPFLFDKFADSKTLHRTNWNRRFKYNNNQKLEYQMFCESDQILYMPSWKSYINLFFSPFLNKSIQVDHPLIVKPEATAVQTETFKTCSELPFSVVFTGALLRNYVEPDFVLRLANCSGLAAKMNFTFYSAGSACGDVGKSNLPNVSIKGWLSKEEMSLVLENADFCLSIAEKSGVQISSKIFTYMSTCKPIIHIYYSTNDINLQYLKNYPLALCILADSEKIEEQAQKIVLWCQTHIGKKVPYQEVLSQFPLCTPEYAKQILERILFLC